MENPFGSGGGLTNSYVSYNPQTFNINTGSCTAWTYGVGPLSTLSASLIKSRPASVSVTFTPTLSQNNNQGSVVTAMFVDDTQLTNTQAYS